MAHRVLPLLRRTTWSLLVLCVAGLAHAQPTPAPQTTWYLAEGATSAFFEEDVLVANPNATAADVEITFLRADGSAPLKHAFTMPATSRRTVRVNAIAGLENSGAVSAIVTCTNGLGIVAERTMYWANGAKRGGHNAPAVAAPAAKWYLAEGATGTFDTFVLIANPDAVKSADVRVTFLKEDGQTVAYPAFSLPPNQRQTIWVNYQVPGLEATSFSTVVESTNGTDLFVERAMYFGGTSSLTRPWEAGHGSAAVTAPAAEWFFGEGFTVDTPAIAFDTFLLLANPNDSAVEATVEFLLENDTPIVKTYRLEKTSRQTVWVDFVPDRDGVLGKSAFSIRVSATAPIIAERAMYWGPQVAGVTSWHEAHNSPGVTSAALAWGFAEGVQGGVDATGLPFETYFLLANPSDTVLSVRATFLREDGTGIVRNYDIAAKTRFTLPATLLPELSNQRFGAFFESTNTVPFVAERAVYWGAGWFGGTGSTGTPFSGTVATPPAPPEPKATSVSPAQGFVQGGTAITITGTDFRAGSTVRVGGAAATGVVVVNATTIRAVTPARPEGAADVVVTAGSTSTTLPAAFTYVALPLPEIFAVTPATGPTGGGTDVTIDGANLGSVVEVRFGTAVASFTILSPTRIRAISPARTVGKVDVSVRTSQDLTTTAIGAFEYVKLLATDNILAFGDSITYGTSSQLVVDSNGTVRKVTTTVAQPYPSLLRSRLAAAYPTQTFLVANGGEPGECASYVGCSGTTAGVLRLPRLLNSRQDLVVVLEGVNDLNLNPDIDRIMRNLRQMVQTVSGAGKRAAIGTLTPVKPGEDLVANGCSGDLCYRASPSAIAALNDRIRSMAATDGILLADFEKAFGSDASLLSPDGLHPNEAGYERMASVLAGLIIANFDGKNPIVP